MLHAQAGRPSLSVDSVMPGHCRLHPVAWQYLSMIVLAREDVHDPENVLNPLFHPAKSSPIWTPFEVQAVPVPDFQCRLQPSPLPTTMLSASPSLKSLRDAQRVATNSQPCFLPQLM